VSMFVQELHHLLHGRSVNPRPDSAGWVILEQQNGCKYDPDAPTARRRARLADLKELVHGLDKLVPSTLGGVLDAALKAVNERERVAAGELQCTAWYAPHINVRDEKLGGALELPVDLWGEDAAGMVAPARGVALPAIKNTLLACGSPILVWDLNMDRAQTKAMMEQSPMALQVLAVGKDTTAICTLRRDRL
jgi:hypothetical protein